MPVKLRITSSRRLVILLLILTGSLFSSNLAASCSSTGDSSVSFGSVSSFTIAVAPTTTSTSDAGINCTAPLLVGLIDDDTAEATVTSAGNGSLTHESNGDSIPFRIFADAAFTEEITLGVPFDYYSPYLLALLGIQSSGSSDLPMYFRTVPDSLNIAAGTYSDTLTVNWYWSVCLIEALGICIGRDEGSATATITISLTITNDCELTAPSVDFGAAPLAANFPEVSQSITIRCTKGTEYSVGLNDGTNALGTQRRMSGNSEHLLYEIYKGNSGTQRWGSVAAERRSSTDADNNPNTYNGVASQSFNYRAKVNAEQSTPASGLYTDTIVVDVSF